MVNYEAAAAITALLSFSIFVVAAANYVSTCEECHILAKKCKAYEVSMTRMGNPRMSAVDRAASTIGGKAREAVQQMRHARFMRSVFFVAQILMGMAVLGALIFMVVRTV